MNTFRQSNGIYTNITTLLPQQQWTQHPGNSMSLNNLNEFESLVDSILEELDTTIEEIKETELTKIQQKIQRTMNSIYKGIRSRKISMVTPRDQSRMISLVDEEKKLINNVETSWEEDVPTRRYSMSQDLKFLLPGLKRLSQLI